MMGTSAAVAAAIHPAAVAAAIDLNGTGHYLTWGWFSISVGNLVVIGLMLLLFALAIFLPFPKGKDRS